MTRSVRIHAFGDADVLHIEDVTIDAPGNGEVRLRIHAIGVNRTELTLRAGRSPVKPVLPSGLGFEAAGVIDAVGPGVTGVAVGDRVALVPSYSASLYPLYGEMSLAPARALVRIPDSTSFVDAAATWAAFGAAWCGLILVGKLKAGQTVLISAASSGVGLAAIQMANRIGAHPVAITRSSAKRAALMAHGASAVIVSDEQNVVDEARRLTDGRGADLVLDAVGGARFAELARASANGATLILYGALAGDATVPSFDIFARDLRVRGFALPSIARDDAHLAALKRFITEGLGEGSLKPVIAKVFPLSDIVSAHRYVEAGRQTGKIVVTV